MKAVAKGEEGTELTGNRLKSTAAQEGEDEGEKKRKAGIKGGSVAETEQTGVEF